VYKYVDKPYFIHRPRLRSKRFREGRSIGNSGDSDGPVAAILEASHAIFTFMNIYPGYPRGYRFERTFNFGGIDTEESRTSKRASASGWARPLGL
jgi:hypothetical protein